MRAGSRHNLARETSRNAHSGQSSAGVAVVPPQRWSIAVAGATAMEHRCGLLLRAEARAGARGSPGRPSSTGLAGLVWRPGNRGTGGALRQAGGLPARPALPVTALPARPALPVTAVDDLVEGPAVRVPDQGQRAVRWVPQRDHVGAELTRREAEHFTGCVLVTDRGVAAADA